MGHLPTIESWTIGHGEQKYDTAGDYWADPPIENPLAWCVRVSEMSDWRYEFLVLMHELTEMALTKHHGVDWKSIDAFDKDGEGKDHPDPGTLPSAPYHNEHMLAVQIEQRLAKMLGVDWEEYNKDFETLVYPEK